MELATSTTFPSAVMVLELLAGAGASYGLYRTGPVIWRECFASDDDEHRLVLAEAGRASPQVSERTPLLPGPKTSKMPTPKQAAQLYSAHVAIAAQNQARPSDSFSSRAATTNAASSSASTPMMTPGASFSDAPSPTESIPSTPTSIGSYMMMREPLYVSDVSLALEKEYKRRQTPTPGSGPELHTTELGTPSTPPTSPVVLSRKLTGLSKQRLFTDDTSYLTASLLCLLHCRDLHSFFLSGRYLDELEDIDNGQHQAVINAFASTASFFWPSNATGSSTHSPLLDLSIFHSLFKKLNGNKRAEDASGNVVQHLLRSLHVALNEGEYCSDQPTYSRTPLKLDAAGDENETAMRNHVDQLRNMQAIQEDSIVKDLFEGLVCMTSRCMACHGITASFESFRVLQVPKPKRPYTTLTELLEDFERPSTSTSRYCATCHTRQPSVETRKLWSLPSVLVFQLSSASPQTPKVFTPNGSPPLAASSPLSHLYHGRRPSHSEQTDYFSVLSTHMEYPISALDMSPYDRDQAQPRYVPTAAAASTSSNPLRSSSPSSSYSGSGSDGADELDLNSVSDDTEHSGTETMYDLFAVRERTLGTSGSKSPSGGLKYRTYAKDPITEDWNRFDGDDVNFIADTRDLVTSHADMLFYRRRS